MICRCCGSPRLKEYCICFDDHSLRYLECRACGSMNLSATYDQVSKAYHTEDYANVFVNYCGGMEALADVFTVQVNQISEAMPAKGAVLDVGCAGGGFLMSAARAGWDVWGFDVSESSRKVAESLPGVGEGKVVVAPQFNARLFDRMFSAVHCCEVIEHVESPRALLQELREALAPSGVLYLQTPTPYGAPRGIWNQVVHLCVMPEDALRWLLHDEGWEIDESRSLTWLRELARGTGADREIQPAGGQYYLCRKR